MVSPDAPMVMVSLLSLMMLLPAVSWIVSTFKYWSCYSLGLSILICAILFFQLSIPLSYISSS
jgi:hypothetical protein